MGNVVNRSEKLIFLLMSLYNKAAEILVFAFQAFFLTVDGINIKVYHTCHNVLNIKGFI